MAPELEVLVESVSRKEPCRASTHSSVNALHCCLESSGDILSIDSNHSTFAGLSLLLLLD